MENLTEYKERKILYLIKYDKKTSEGLFETVDAVRYRVHKDKCSGYIQTMKINYPVSVEVAHMKEVINKRVKVNNVHIINRCNHKYHDRGIITSHKYEAEQFKLPIGTHRYYLLNSEQPSLGDYVMTSHYKTPNKRGFITELDKYNGMCVIDNEYIVNTSEIIYIVTNPELMTKEYEKENV